MDYVTPTEIISDALQAARKKAALSVRDMLVRGILAGAFLGYATSLVFVVNTQGTPPILGAVLFPVGFVMLVLLGLELATGNFALLPMGALSGEVRWRELLRNWSWVYVGNLMGSVLYAALFFLAITSFRTNDGGAAAALVKQVALKKTVGYMAIGGSGWATAVVKAILCNWMVTIGTVLALVSRSTIGKIVAMWLPITLFFALGYEHSIVNMFVIPAGMLMGAPISMRQWWVWNQIPVTLGNGVAGFLFTGLALHITHGAKTAKAARVADQSQLEMKPSLAPGAEMAS
ncbi:MAG TPA: formate/nitrite transporter family protein [Terriglobales bacterium]|nr:formate/nitrite transporter family protein [Terriglobales bacterium]